MTCAPLNALEHGPKKPRDLALALGLTTGAVTSLIDRLERRGLVLRSPDPDDRRGVLVVPTPSDVCRPCAALPLCRAAGCVPGGRLWRRRGACCGSTPARHRQGLRGGGVRRGRDVSGAADVTFVDCLGAYVAEHVNENKSP